MLGICLGFAFVDLIRINTLLHCPVVTATYIISLRLPSLHAAALTWPSQAATPSHAAVAALPQCHSPETALPPAHPERPVLGNLEQQPRPRTTLARNAAGIAATALARGTASCSTCCWAGRCTPPANFHRRPASATAGQLWRR